MLDLNILYKSKYFGMIHIEHNFYVSLLEGYIVDKLQKMS